MTWTYLLSEISITPIYQVRFLIGDTDPDNHLLEDEEISFIISQQSTIYGAAAECCRSLASQAAQSVDRRAGDTEYKDSQMGRAYTIMAISFGAKAAATGAAMPFAGGISIDDKNQRRNDADRVTPQFSIGLDDNSLPVSPAGPNDLQGGNG